MKRLLLSIFGVSFLSLVVTAQNSSLPFAPRVHKAQQTGDEQVYDFGQNSQRLSNYDDTIWFDSFESPSTWSINNQNANGWKISSTNTTNIGTWYFQNTRITSTTGGNYAVLVPDNPNQSPTATFHTISTASPIDISGYSNQNLVLHYEKYGARFVDTLKVQVSNDNTNWTTLDFNTDFPLLSTTGGSVTANPASRDLFIPTSIVNGNTLYIRFAWDADIGGQNNAIGYGWFIDDIAVFDIPTNDLVLDQTAFFDDVRLLYSWYYGAMPERQAETDQITFSATYENRGSATQTNSRLELDITGQETISFSSASTNVAPGLLADTARTTTIYAPSNGIGTYTFTWNIESDQTDEIPSNNTYSVDMSVTENEYSMAPLPIASANVLGKAGAPNTEPYVITQGYFFNADDTVTSMGVAFDEEFTNVGATFQLSILDENEQPVAISDVYIVDQCMMDEDELVYFPISETVIPAGAYDAKIEVISDSLYLVSCQDPIPPIEPAGGGGFFSRTTISYGGSNFIEDMVYLTIRTKNNPNCSPNLEVAGIVEYSPSEEPVSASIDILDVMGLTGCVFEYEWEGPNGFSEDDIDLEDLTVNGTYTIEVSDADGCVATNSFLIEGLGADEIIGGSNISLFPNPTKGDFSLNFDKAFGEYEINVTNALGQVVATRTVRVSGSNQVVAFNNMNLDKGVYTISVQNTDENAAPSTEKIVVE